MKDLDYLKANCKMIKERIEMVVPKEDLDGLSEHLLSLARLTANAAECKATASRLLKQKQLVIIKENMEDKIPASILSKLIDSECASEHGWMTYADRLNAGLSHAIEGYRSVLSFEKAMIENKI